jgi:hypothetical protein
VRNGVVPQPGSVRCTTPAATMSNGGGRRAMLLTFLVTQPSVETRRRFGEGTPAPALSGHRGRFVGASLHRMGSMRGPRTPYPSGRRASTARRSGFFVVRSIAADVLGLRNPWLCARAVLPKPLMTLTCAGGRWWWSGRVSALLAAAGLVVVPCGAQSA